MTTALTRKLRGACAALMLALPLLAHALELQLSIDTTALAGTEGYIALDLLAGTPGTTNQVVVGAFSSTATLGTATRAGNVLGTWPADLTLASTVFFNEYLQALTFGAGLTSFSLSLSTNYLPASVPDSFAVYLLDATLAPYATTDPSGAGALVVIDLVSSPLPQVYESPFAVATLVPEPAAATLALAGLALLVARRRLQRA